MNYVGGYVMVDFSGLDVSELPATLNGAYDQLETAYETGKPVIVKGVENDGYPFSPTPISLIRDASTDFTMSFAGVAFKITEEDEISV